MIKRIEVPKDWQEIDKQEQVKHLDNVCHTLQTRIDNLNDLKQRLSLTKQGYPEDLYHYTNYLLHDASRDTLNLGFHVRKERVDSLTWKIMWQCLSMLNHINVLTELLHYRRQDL